MPPSAASIISLSCVAPPSLRLSLSLSLSLSHTHTHTHSLTHSLTHSPAHASIVSHCWPPSLHLPPSPSPRKSLRNNQLFPIHTGWTRERPLPILHLYRFVFSFRFLCLLFFFPLPFPAPRPRAKDKLHGERRVEKKKSERGGRQARTCVSNRKSKASRAIFTGAAETVSIQKGKKRYT
ncbi:hypothetical protein LZ31DRAFT_205761 [Colletotrichum somersetense]|nr:hypothetical protein LZ31DRAFT_205761 [Colletotrichum somersetense]